MIEINALEKKFEEKLKALDGISLLIREQQVFGLIGTNGAGKSTLLRILCGILKQDAGEVLVDGQTVYDNPKVKSLIFFISDEPWFFRNASPATMKNYYSQIYPAFDKTRCENLLRDFSLDMDRKISTFSKGMKKQLAVILGISSGSKYLICDETFDGLDPVMRQGVKSIFANDMLERGMTPIIASHNLRELEDICDHIGLLHQGGVLLNEDLDNMKLNIQKVQAVFSDENDLENLNSHLHVLKQQQTGRLRTFTIRGSREEVEEYFRGISTVYFEILPLTLEEIFISETEVVGYDVKKFILH